ncbi:sensor histidine kinase KdpD [Clostridium sp. YIM B02551]|uniref:sensor histidine kinase n=1 Tax=Clostridium sp. YIM B02551 TaxID=2910679 RepID=UPI001EEADC74|nr:HAMP domain-containing sensor histidine kinase [Clostridium sp. YIM B02551]
MVELREETNFYEILGNTLTDYEKKVNLCKDLQGVREDFILNIAHDLRTHLNVVLSVIQLLKIKHKSVNEGDKKWEEYTQTITKSCYKMLKLVNNLIDVTKLENDYFICNKENLDIICLVENIVNSVNEYAKCKNISIIFDTNEEECKMSVDPEVIDRIVMNLLSNAIKFSPKNSEILVNLTVSEEEVKIEFKDQGPGIPKEEMELIFNRFHKVVKNITSEYEGNGIGLNLVYNLVKTHNGNISVYNNTDKGCNFVVTLPRCIDEECGCSRKIKANTKVQVLEIEFSDIY